MCVGGKVCGVCKMDMFSFITDIQKECNVLQASNNVLKFTASPFQHDYNLPTV